MRSITRCFSFYATPLERSRSGHKDQGEPTGLRWRLESVLVGQKYFIATLSAVFVSKLRRYVKKSQKRWIKESSMQPRKVHDFLSEIMLYKLKQLDDISLRRIKILLSGWSESLPYIEKSRVFIFRIIWIAISISQIQGVYKAILNLSLITSEQIICKIKLLLHFLQGVWVSLNVRTPNWRAALQYWTY